MDPDCSASLPFTGLARALVVALALAAPIQACNCGDSAVRDAPDPPSAPVIAIEPVDPGTADDLTLKMIQPSVDPEGREVRYLIRWLLDGTVVPELTEGVVPASRTTKGQAWKVEVTATNGLVSAAPVAASVTIANGLPQTELSFDPARPTAATGVRVLPVSTDPDGDRVTLRFSWKKDGASTPFDGDTVPAAAVVRGQAWEASVVPNDGETDGPTTTAQIRIANSLPEIAGIELLPAQPTREGSIAVSAGAVTDIDGDATTLRYVWLVDGSAVPGQTSTSLSPAHFARGQRVSVVVTAFDGLEEGPAVVAATVVANAPPSITGALMTPSAGGRGTVFSCVPQGWSDADGDPEQVEVEWLVDGAPAGLGPTFNTLALSRGQEVRCRATPVNEALRGTAATSPPVVLSNTPPSLAEARLTPADPRVRDTLQVVVVGFVDADGDPPAYRYTWRRNGVAMPSAGTGATASGVFTRGDRVTVAVEPFDGLDYGAPVVTNEVVVRNTPPVLEGVSLAPAPPTKSGPISATVSGARDDDGDVVSVRYLWKVNGAVVSNPSATLPSVSFSRGQTVEVVATPFDGVDDGAAVSASAVVANSPPAVTSLAIAPVGVATVTRTTPIEAKLLTFDPDGDTVTVPSYEWRVSTPAGSRTITTTTATLPANSLVHNEQVVVAVVPSDGLASGAVAVSNRLVVGNTPPTAPSVALSAEHPTFGDRLVCTASGATDPDGEGVGYSFDWRRNGAAFSSFTSSGASSEVVLAPASLAVGDRLTCTAAATDGYATGPSSAAVEVRVAGCGDGLVASPEQCDDGNASDVDACRNSCVAASCGDGVKRTDLSAGQPGYEACDDGNAVDSDGCRNSCAAAACGDGVVRSDVAAGQPGYEACDDGNADSTDACVGCRVAACGDGFVRAGVEACDDGNASDEDACLSTCVAARCGDGIARVDLAPGAAGYEACDDGNASDTDGCLAGCVAARCGDGKVWAGVEGCDDGNTANGDGCDSTCQVERAGCLNPGTITFDWSASPAPVLTATNANWAIRTGTANNGPDAAIGRRMLTSNPPPEFGPGRNDSVRLPMLDFSSFGGCTISVSFSRWVDVRSAYDGVNLQVTDDPAPSSSSVWKVVTGSSMGYDRTSLSTASCATCFMAGQPVWSRVSGLTTAFSTTQGVLTTYAGKRNVSLRFAFHSDASGTTTLYNGIFIGNVTIEAK